MRYNDYTYSLKQRSSLTGDESTIPNHKDITDQLDYEGELGIVIGKSGEKFRKH